MLNLALISRADWSQQGFSLEEVRVLVWSAPGCWLQEEVLDIRELQSIFLSYVNKDLIFFRPFFLSLDHSYRLTHQIFFFFFPKGFPDGTLQWAMPILARAVCSRCLCTRTKPTKANQTRTSPARSHTPNETKGKEMPRNQKPSVKSAPKRW